MTEPTKEAARSAILVDMLYAVAIGINVWLLIDTATGGELTRQTKVLFTHLTEDWRRERQAERQLRHDEFEVVQQAADIVKEA